VKYNQYQGFDERPDPQPTRSKKIAKPQLATKTCTVEFENCIVDLVEGCEVHGLKREEREYLKFHGFVE